MSYGIVWKFDVDDTNSLADGSPVTSHEAAALYAYESFTRPGSIAHVFSVTDEAGVERDVDLDEDGAVRNTERITEPYTDEQLRDVMDDDGYVTAIIALDLGEVIDNSLDGVNELMSATVTGDDYALEDIGWEVVGHESAASILVSVTGSVKNYLEQRDND